jgi:hypothetical protein
MLDSKEKEGERESKTYVGKTTVGAAAYLRFVDVDEDARVTEGTAAAVALDGFFLDPADGLFVDELDGCQWARLFCVFVSAMIPHNHQFSLISISEYPIIPIPSLSVSFTCR